VSDKFPFWFSAVSLTRDQVIDFYEWVIEDRAWRSRIYMEGWHESHFRAAIANWRKNEEHQRAVLEVHFSNEADAVAFKLRYPEADYHGQEDVIKA
jgi:hypothetical protein